jgi:hypothetical protein
MATQNLGYKSYLASDGVKPFRIVKADDTGGIVLADAGDAFVGVTMGDVDYAGYIAVRNKDAGTFKVEVAASKAVAVGDLVKPDATGAVEESDDGSNAIGVALTAGTSTATDGAIVECAWLSAPLGSGNGGGDTSALETLVDVRTLGDAFVIDDQTDDDEGAYQVPDGTSVVSIDRETLSGEVKLLPPADAPSVILVVQAGGDLDAVKWDDDALNLCPLDLLIRTGTHGWVEAPLDNAFEYRMNNETFTITGEQGTVEVPAGTGAVVCEGLTDAVTLDMTGSFYPQVIIINNAVGGHAVTFEGNTIDAAGISIFVNFGGTWVSLSDE